MSAAANSSTVASTTVENAVSALLKWKESNASTEKLKLLPDDEFIYLILTLKRIPPKPRTNAYKIPLPHPLYSSPSLCLIVDDRAGAKPTSDTVKQIIVAQNLNVEKVIKLSKLKSNYKAFEAKRKLCDSFDLFLADKRIVHFLPKLLGGMFFKKKKLPVPVDMGKNWRAKVERVASDGLLYFRTGTCCVMKIGRGSMEKGEIVENVRKGVDGVVEFVPKKWGGVRSMHLKMADSVALPLYQALPDLKLRIEGASTEVQGVDEAKGESLNGDGDGDGDGLGSELKIGGKKKKDKGRIHEVRYMDIGLSEEEVGSEDSEGDEENEREVSEDEGEQSGKRKKRDVEDVESDDEITDAMDGAKPVRAKKQKKEKKLENVKPKKVTNESSVKKVNEKGELAAEEGERKQIKKKSLEYVKPKKVIINESTVKKVNEKDELSAKKGDRKQMKERKPVLKKVTNESPLKKECKKSELVAMKKQGSTTPKKESKKSELGAKKKQGSTTPKEKRSKTRVLA